MKKSLREKETIKNYLLGKISDEETLAEIEEFLFTDEEFSAEAELVEDEIIEAYAFKKLSPEDRNFAKKYFLNDPERQFKLKLTQQLREKAKEAGQTAGSEKPSFFETLKSFFRQPVYAGAFAVLLIAVIGFAIYFFRDQRSSELAQLQLIYQKERPVEPRISEFGYAPLNIVRGQNENPENISKLRRIEIGLHDAVEKDPTAENQRALGVFYLTQRKFTDAIRELENAVRLDEKNAKIRNDLGSAFFELAKSETKDKKETLGKALENFSQAVELNPDLLEALFNKALCQQELGLYNEAKKTWALYLEKDQNSEWANEARRHLEILENLKTSSKPKEQVLEDFLKAYPSDESLAWKINCQTKEMISGVWLPGQLSHRYLEARHENDVGKMRESIDALQFIGELEKKRNADFFVAELAEYYLQIEPSKIENLLKAKDLMKNGYQALNENKDSEAVVIFNDAAKLFSAAENDLEAKTAEFWSAQSKPREGKINESLENLTTLAKYFDEKRYKWLFGQATFWIADNYFFQREFTKSIELCKQSFKIFEEISDVYGMQKSVNTLTTTFDKIGKSRESLKFIGQTADAKDLYYYSERQAWRDTVYRAIIFNRLDMFYVAESFGRESLVLGKEVLKDADAQNFSLETLAKIYSGEKRFEEALDLANQSKDLAQNKPKGMKNFLLAKAILQIAELKRQMERCGEAVADYDSAIQLYSQIPEIKLYDFVAHKGKLLCFQQLQQQENLDTELASVLELSEKYRSHILKDEERQAFFDSEQIVYDVAIENSLSKGAAQKAFELAESSKARSLLDFIEGKKSIADLQKQFVEVAKPLSLAEIQTRIPENVQLVQFAVLPKKTVIWVLTKSEIKTVEADISKDDLEKKVSDYLELVVEKNGDAEIRKSGKELYGSLVKPILSSLDPSKEIFLIGDKMLHNLPFSSLTSEDGKFLIEDFKLSNAPSASVFVFATEKAREHENIKDERLLSVGNPAFDKEQNADLAALSSAEEEVKKIAEFYPNKKQFFGPDALKESFLNELPNAEIIHFAGHYVANDESPSYSKLLFAANGTEGDLRAFEIAGTKLPRSKMAVLSACGTGVEKFYSGEGAIGMARVFLAVGTPLVVASQWKVDSEATKDLMIAFHRNRREKNLPAAEALRAAQIEMLNGANGENFRQPYFWSAFSIIGGSANY